MSKTIAGRQTAPNIEIDCQWEQTKQETGERMDYINNKGQKIGSLDIAISNDKSVTINRINDVTTVIVRDRNTGKVSTETFFGDSPFGD
jgi:hypothetical protein